MLGTLLFQEGIVYRMSERKVKLSLVTLAFLMHRHPVREGRQGRQGREVRKELMVWLMQRKAAKQCVEVSTATSSRYCSKSCDRHHNLMQLPQDLVIIPTSSRCFNKSYHLIFDPGKL